MKSALKETQGKAGERPGDALATLSRRPSSAADLTPHNLAGEKGGGAASTDAASPVSKAKQGDLGDDRGGDPSKAKKEDPQKTAGNPGTHTAHDKDSGEESTTEKVGSAQRSRQPGSLGTPSSGARGTGGGTAGTA